MGKIKVAIVEDLRDVSDFLRTIFNQQEDMECQQVYYTAEDAMHFLALNPADILIVDIGLPKASGIEAMHYLTEFCPGMQYCMFTVYEDDDKIFSSMQSGAKGYILKGSSPEKILQAVRELYMGGSPMSPSIARRILDMFQTLRKEPAEVALPLTQRELEILTLVSKGLLYKEIGDRLQISIGTVKQHLNRIYGKLQVSNKTEAINKLKSWD